MKKEEIIIEFYRKLIFGSEFENVLSLENCIKYSVSNAYRDLSRTLSGIADYANNKGNAFKYLETEFYQYFSSDIKNQQNFDNWHKDLSVKLKEIFNGYKRNNKDFGFTIGNAQKWINMTFKYLYTYTLEQDFDIKNIDEYFTPCHIALDKLTIRWINEQVFDGENYIKNRWSVLNSYDVYLDIQTKAREYIISKYDTSPFLKEFDIFQNYA